MPRRSFTDWKREVNEYLIRLCGLDADCLPDVDYYSYYEQKTTPERAARKAIRIAKEY